MRYRKKHLDLESKRCHALTVSSYQFFALAGRLAVLFHAVAKFEKTVIACSFRFRACTAATVLDIRRTA